MGKYTMLQHLAFCSFNYTFQQLFVQYILACYYIHSSLEIAVYMFFPDSVVALELLN
jgi:hypothetical protein